MEHALRAQIAGYVRICRHRVNEVLIEFDDGTRLFVDGQTPLELSITGNSADKSGQR